MNSVSDEQYTSFLERLIRVTHDEPYKRDNYVKVITEISEAYRLAKGMTEFYRTPIMEQRGMGEVFCDWDNGKKQKILLRIRIVSVTKAVVIGTLYANEDDEERDEEDIKQLDTLLRIIIGFVSRMRLIRVIEEFGFSDLEGYANFRAFARYLDVSNDENLLGGKTAFHIDLHNFTLVNQEIGRENGDAVIRRYHNLIKDVIGDKGIIARLGGDKFIGVFDDDSKDRIMEIFNGVPIPCDEQEEKRIIISAAAGLYTLPNPYMFRTYGDIMDKIMLAGSIAKAKVGIGIVYYSDKMKSEREHVKKIQAEFRNGLEKEEFAVYYQPKVNVETREIIGCEALCRWIKDGKIVPPMEFIPILERNMYICDLDFYMLDHVCSNIRHWMDLGNEPIRASVNFSRKHLVNVDLVDHIISVIDKHNVPHEFVEIEFTETTTDVTFNDLKRVVCALQAQGVWSAVDDFGDGYSSLKLIREIPWDVLKIDKSIVPEEFGDYNSLERKMFRHVIALAQDIGLKCVIEGVETKDQVEIMKKNNCLIAQGYYFDKPLPREEFEARVKRKVYPLT